MKRAVFLLSFIFLSVNNHFLADIAPDPTIAKGIIPSHPVNIQMVSEVVRAKLTLDSSEVTCTFYMHNLGRQTDLEVGFPVMNYYMWQNNQVSPIDQNKFEVFINGRAINKTDTYIPDSLKKIFSEKNGYREHERDVYNLFRNYDNLNKPWYLWKMHFRADEYLTIVVKYVLPNGYTKSNMYFNYLLSTGAGWKGEIKDAKVIVNLSGLPSEQVLKVIPRPYRHDLNILTWHFKNIKPVPQNDILIEYERNKGDYKSYTTHQDSIRPTFIDGQKIKRSLIDTAQIGDVYIEKHPDERYVEVFFTKGFILKKLKETARKSDPGFWRNIVSITPVILDKECYVYINGVRMSGDILYENLNNIDSTNAVVGEVKTIKGGRRKIIIKTKNPIPHPDFIHESPQ